MNSVIFLSLILVFGSQLQAADPTADESLKSVENKLTGLVRHKRIEEIRHNPSLALEQASKGYRNSKVSEEERTEELLFVLENIPNSLLSQKTKLLEGRKNDFKEAISGWDPDVPGKSAREEWLQRVEALEKRLSAKTEAKKVFSSPVTMSRLKQLQKILEDLKNSRNTCVVLQDGTRNLKDSVAREVEKIDIELVGIELRLKNQTDAEMIVALRREASALEDVKKALVANRDSLSVCRKEFEETEKKTSGLSNSNFLVRHVEAITTDYNNNATTTKSAHQAAQKELDNRPIAVPVPLP